MRLALSSWAAPDFPLAALLEGCRRRGLAALELVPGHAHGVEPGADSPGEARRAADDAGVALVAVDLTDGAAEPAAGLGLAACLGAPALVPAEHGTPSISADLLRDHCGRGGRVLLHHRTEPGAASALRAVAEALPPGGAGLAWEVDPAADEPARVGDVIAAAGPALAYVRLRGGGPEAPGQTGLGVGALMARLALARYAGPLVLTPSAPALRPVWRTWLGRSGGWGCGSRRSDPSLVTLSRDAGA